MGIARQIGMNPFTHEIEADNIVGEVRQALENVVRALGAGGARPDQIYQLVHHRQSGQSRQRARDRRSLRGSDWKFSRRHHGRDQQVVT